MQCNKLQLIVKGYGFMDLKKYSCPKIASSENNLCKHHIPSVDKVTGKPDDCAGFCGLPSEFRCIEDMKHKAIKISHSASRNYLTCKLKFWYSSICGIGMKPECKGNALKMGGLWDTVQSVIYGHKTKSDIDGYISKYEMDDESIYKVMAMYEAYKELIVPDLDGVEVQKEVTYAHLDDINNDVIIHGITDRSYSDHFVECKFSGKPNDYTQSIFRIASQVGTYFLCDDSYKYAILEVVRTPQLRKGENEEVEAFGTRIYKDIMSRPSYYFVGYNKINKKFGVMFYRNEFEPFIRDVESRYKWIVKEIRESVERNSWYGNDTGCFAFGGKCDYYSICENGNGWASEGKYIIKEKE